MITKLDIIHTIIGLALFGVGLLFILALVGGKKCVHCNRNVDETQDKCICGNPNEPR